MNDREALDALAAVRADLEHYASTHGPGPDRRLADYERALTRIRFRFAWSPSSDDNRCGFVGRNGGAFCGRPTHAGDRFCGLHRLRGDRPLLDNCDGPRDRP